MENYIFKLYPITVNKKNEWVAECLAVENCIGQGETIQEAVDEMQENLKIILEEREIEKIEIPKTQVDEYFNNFSGKFTVRLSKSLHKLATERAESENISLNQLVYEAITQHIANKNCIEQVTYTLDQSVKAIEAAANTKMVSRVIQLSDSKFNQNWNFSDIKLLIGENCNE